MAAINRTRQPHTIYLADDEYAAVRAAAEAQGLNFNDYLRTLIEKFVPEQTVSVVDRVADVERRLVEVERRLGRFGLVTVEAPPAALAVDVQGEPKRRARRTGGGAGKREG